MSARDATLIEQGTWPATVTIREDFDGKYASTWPSDIVSAGLSAGAGRHVTQRGLVAAIRAKGYAVEQNGRTLTVSPLTRHEVHCQDLSDVYDLAAQDANRGRAKRTPAEVAEASPVALRHVHHYYPAYEDYFRERSEIVHAAALSNPAANSPYL